MKITKRQSEILEILIANTKKAFGGYPGLSRTEIEKLGVSHSTFHINIDFLISHYLIDNVSIEFHGEEEWKYYDATVLGFIIWYQSKFKKKVLPYISSQLLERFFPLIHKHWDELDKIFEDDREGCTIIGFLDTALSQISFYFYDKDRSEYFGERGFFEPVANQISLDFGDHKIILKGEFNFLAKGFSWKRREGIRPDFDDRHVWHKNISDKVTFLVFFNMFQRKASYKYGSGVITLDLFDEYLEPSEAGKELLKHYKKTIKSVLIIIKKDKDLNKIFLKGLSYLENIQKNSMLNEFLLKFLK